MPVLKATLVSANAVDEVHNLWELTLMLDDDLGNPKKYLVRSTYAFKNSELKRFKVTLKNNEVKRIEQIQIEAVD
ncbi:MAG TPA: hypothetical protein G4O12_06180 [Dehalococcoidia bacterium]|nr:hypothetical protein [Dehalococcoidia bacterium]